MNEIIWTILLSIAPVSELRGGIVYGLLHGLSPGVVFLISVISNLLVIPLIFFFLDYLNKGLMKIKLYEKVFNYYVNKKVNKVKRKYQTLELFVLFLFVAIPSPGTGAYTGVLLSWFFNLDRWKSYWVIGIGVVCAGIITLLASLGIINFFKF